MPRISTPLGRRAVLLGIGLALAGGLGGAAWLVAADHRDSASLTADPAADIADVFAFRSPSDPSRLALAMTVSGFIPPTENATTYFDPNVLYQFRIDNTGDGVEDLVLQAYVTGAPGHQVMHLRGPARPETVGSSSRILDGPETATVRVSQTAEAIVASRDGVSAFAGVRDDPFFFDLTQFRKIVAGQASAFNDPGTDTFAGFNVLAIVVELPASMLGSNPQLGIWGTTSRPL